MITSLADGEFEKLYKLGRTLGQGTFATVKIGTCLADRSKWAIKVVKRSALSASDENSLRTEIQIICNTSHKYIVQVKEVLSTKKYVYIVMELMTGGELFDRIVAKDHYSEQAAQEAIKMIISAVKYCHDRNVIHRYNNNYYYFCLSVML
jgi:serine/threonine protein kinase